MSIPGIVLAALVVERPKGDVVVVMFFHDTYSTQVPTESTGGLGAVPIAQSAPRGANVREAPCQMQGAIWQKAHCFGQARPTWERWREQRPTEVSRYLLCCHVHSMYLHVVHVPV